MDLFYQPKLAVYLLLVCCIAFSVSYYLQFNPQNHWLIWSSLFISLLTLSSVGVLLPFCTGFIVAVMVFIVGVLAHHDYVLPTYLFAVTFICLMVEQRYPYYFLIPFTITLFTIVASLQRVPLSLNVDRALYIVAGTLVATLLQSFLLFKKKYGELFFSLKCVLLSLSSLTQDIFACLLYPEYVDNVYLFERRIHGQKYRFFQSITQLRGISHYVEKKIQLNERQVLQEVLNKLEMLFDVIVDCGQLRNRVSDYSTFQLCAEELGGITKELKNIFDQLINQSHLNNTQVDVTLLKGKIKRFEENFTNVLQVSAKDPLIFLLFISSLNALCEAIAALSASLFAVSKLEIFKSYFSK